MIACAGAQVVTLEFDAPAARQDAVPSVDLRSATPGYFKTMGIPLVDGRNFDVHDAAAAPMVALIDERLAHLMWPGERAAGKRLRVPAVLMNGVTMPWIEIIGVVGHVIHDGIDLDTRPQVYFHQQQRAQDRMVLVVRADRSVSALTASVIAAIHDVDPEQPVYDVRTMQDVVDRSLGQRWMNMTLVGTFAAVALALSSIGVYGVIAFGVARQRREFGIRLALGASRRGIAASVVSRGAALAAIGIAAGLLFAGVLTRSMTSLLFGVDAADLTSFGAATIVLLAVALLASYLPARRAAAVEPAITLRAE